MKNIYAILTIFFLLFFTVDSIQATTIQKHSYLLTNGEEFIGTPLLPSVLTTKSLYMGYRSGRVVISSTEDGTGPINIPDDIVVNLVTPTNEAFRVNPGCPTSEKPPIDISHLLWKARSAGYANLSISLTYTKCKTTIRHNGMLKDYAKVGRLYIVHFDDYDASVPSPFLELPWNYKGKNLSFSDAALAMTSYFDHTFPLLSTSLAEPDTDGQSITTYENTTSPLLAYSSHDGYDWAYKAGATIEEPVLAAADGIANYVNTCASCGNAIYIDHGNGYQTRYYHLLTEGLLTTDTAQKINVKTGQIIGKVGYTGNVIPAGSGGAHLHFMVIYDKNHDGNFDDNIPDGIVDPFGWQSEIPDPWEHYTFSYKGQLRTGAKSTYLWKNEITTIKNTVTSNGGTFSIDTAKIIIPKNMINQDSILTLSKVEPPPDDTLSTIKNVRILLKDGWGNVYTNFQTAFNFVLNFSPLEITRYKPETLSIYSSSDRKTWSKETTSINTSNGQASISVKHLSEFALRGEKKDSISPVSTILFEGSSYSNNIFVSPVEISLDATDLPETESLGIDYILYKLDTDSWREYTTPLRIESQGDHTISYYAVDGDGNSEKPVTASFSINYSLLTPTSTPTPTITPTPTHVYLTPTLKPSPTTKFTPTPKPRKPQKNIPYFCKLMNQKKYSSFMKRLQKKYSKEHLQKLCD